MIDCIRSRLVHLLAVALAVATVAGLTACGDNLEPPDVTDEEQCNIPGDEDGDGQADCADSDCADSPVCGVCGDGVRNVGEGCDDGNQVETDACTNSCVSARCGDGIVQAGVDECDDGNTINTDACTNACTAARCGDGITGPGEQCDDGNQNNNDGCTNACQMMRCGDGIVQGGEACDDGNMVNEDGCTNACMLPTCGDGFVQAGEQCDDANMVNTDACLNTCMTARCGDGVVREGAGAEACDDADTDAGDGCSATCTVEAGYACNGAPSMCATVCGDGIIAGAETCDQGGGNMAGGDGCSATCAIENGYVCFGLPSTCINTCGNNMIDAMEQCEDGNTVAGDGCSACQFDIGCAAGETQVAVSAMPALAIPDNMPAAPVTSDVMVNSAQVVSKVVVYLDSLTHTWDSDLTIGLVSPRGVLRDLSSGNGSSGDNYTRTFIDDGAATAITAGTAPFTGRFRPEQSISTSGAGFRGQLAGGTWSLRLFDTATGDTGTLNAWTLLTCTSLQVPVCGNGNVDAGEECDDANTDPADACSNACGFTDGCGDGNIDAGEDCDDDGLANGDGCSSTCQIEFTCPAGQTAVVVQNAMSQAIPDNDQVTGVSSVVSVPTTGSIVSATVLLGRITHPNAADIEAYLVSARGIQRELTTDNGSIGDNFVSTAFNDAATVAITSVLSGAAPFTGVFRPEQTLSTTSGVDYRRQNAAGDWTLRVFDDLANNTGSLDRWKLLLCVDAAATYCGDGIVNDTEECDDGNAVANDACGNLCQVTDGCGDGNLDMGETCDDDNLASGDGCSMTCVPEIACPAGQTAVIASNTTAAAIPDNDQVTGVSSTVTVAAPGAIASAKVYIASLEHTNDTDLDIYLDAPSGVRRELSTDNGSTGDNYYNTTLDDTATTAVTAGTAPFNGRFRPEFSLSSTANTDFRHQRSDGTWTLRVFDDLANNTGTLRGWTLLACVDNTDGYCGDGMVNGGEECDDGNSSNADNCTTACSIVDGCGDGNIDTGEACDDNNVVSGDGCSSTCTLDIGCAAGEMAVLATNSTPVMPPDSNNAGILSGVTVNQAGLVRRAIVTVNVTHPANSDIDMWVMSPWGAQRELTTERSGANFRATTFSDAAATAITSGAAPYTGTFRPAQSLDVYNNQSSAGEWVVRIADDAGATNTGMLTSWTLALCVDPSVTKVCGNGIVESGESCDDGNTTAGDGCSATCVMELNCAAGEVAVITTSADAKLLPPDNNTTGVTSTIAVAAAGNVTKAYVGIGNIGHTFDADLDISLIGSNGTTTLDLSSDNGSSGDDYLGTLLADSATVLISAATGTAVSPFRGFFKPEAALSGVNGQAATGDWSLKVVDDLPGDGGVVRHWTIGLCTAAAP
jgi:cysteine-rich repeat protein